MSSTSNRLFISTALFCTTFILQTAHAGQPSTPATTPDHFLIQLPDVDHEALVEQLMTLRSQLIQHKQALLQVIKDNTLDSSDTLITIIVPGGLLYAGYKKASCEQAKDKLASVNASIEEFSADLLAMQTGAPPVAVAQLHQDK